MSCDYNDAYILVRGTITVGTGGSDVGAGQTDEKNKDVILKKLCTIQRLHNWNK